MVRYRSMFISNLMNNSLKLKQLFKPSCGRRSRCQNAGADSERGPLAGLRASEMVPACARGMFPSFSS